MKWDHGLLPDSGGFQMVSLLKPEIGAGIIMQLADVESSTWPDRDKVEEDPNFQKDFRPIDESCSCSTFSRHSRAFLQQIATHEASAYSLLSVHNFRFQMRRMRRIAEAIRTRSFPEFIQQFMLKVFPEKDLDIRLPSCCRSDIGELVFDYICLPQEDGGDICVISNSLCA
ncbi:unnamed protein product, partial [Cyprideis torosa]